ncbi:MAG: hypothetical protein JOZ36_06365 [Acidobacteria bacterium]|nr:hypothetical protein [Acidobacteriota bacterium]
MRNVTVGNISVRDPERGVFGRGMGMDNEPWHLRIRNKFLKDFVVTLDFQHRRITLAVP